MSHEPYATTDYRPRQGDTLSQIGVAIRLQRSANWVRRQGDYVSSNNRDGKRETWARREFSNRRCAGYEFVR